MKLTVSFRYRFLFIILAISWALAGTLLIFQYQREKKFRTELLDARLQADNAMIANGLRRGADIREIVGDLDSSVENPRVTVIGETGNVIYDSRGMVSAANHNTRPEIAAARASGHGIATERHSESDGSTYFYSATLTDDGVVIRTAAPYTHSLETFLKADRSLIWIMLAITLIMSVVAFIVTGKISLSIRRLSAFAEQAERGEPVLSSEAFPNDELGNIASNIVKLYIQRDARHRDALRHEKEKIRIKKQLTNNINHELKTPVSAILVCIDVLADHPEIEESKKYELITLAKSNAQRLDTLLKDVADITRMDEGQEMIKKCEINLAESIINIINEYRMRTHIVIEANIPPMTIYGNRRLIESIFRNLFDNAIAYSGASRIILKADSQGNFCFSDNGSGISEEHLPHIFERFYRVDKGRSRESGGTGLGLAIVKNAVAIHGGTIRAVSLNGLSFYFNLPPKT